MRPSGFLRVPLRAHGLMLHKSCGHRVVAVRLHPEEGSSVLYLDLGIVTILIVINGLLAMSELAIVSSRPARLAGLVEKGVRGPAVPSPSHLIPANSCPRFKSASR
jgi:hypothetical protein